MELSQVSRIKIDSESNCIKDVLCILSSHGCTRKFTCHVMHRARAPNAKTNNDRADGHIALLGFNDLGRSVTPTFLSETDFIYNYLHIVQK